MTKIKYLSKSIIISKILVFFISFLFLSFPLQASFAQTTNNAQLKIDPLTKFDGSPQIKVTISDIPETPLSYINVTIKITALDSSLIEKTYFKSNTKDSSLFTGNSFSQTYNLKPKTFYTINAKWEDSTTGQSGTLQAKYTSPEKINNPPGASTNKPIITLEKIQTAEGKDLISNGYYFVKINFKNAPIGTELMIEQTDINGQTQYFELYDPGTTNIFKVKTAEFEKNLWIIPYTNSSIKFNFIKYKANGEIDGVATVVEVSLNANTMPETTTRAPETINSPVSSTSGGTIAGSISGQALNSSTTNNKPNLSSNNGPARREMKGPNTIQDLGGSTLGQCPDIKFNLNFTDIDNNIESFNLSSDGNYPVTAPDFYKSGGAKLKLSLKSYDLLTDEKYNLDLDSSEELDYGSYKLKNSADKKIKILPGSYLKLAEEDDGVFSGEDDVFTLTIQTKNDQNVMIMKKENNGYTLPQDDCDLDFDIETVKKYIDGQIKLEIPIVKAEENRTVQAMIIFKNGSMQFISGLEAQNISNGNTVESETGGTTSTEKEVKKGPRKPIGFTGTNLEIMEKDAYKGISNETQIETTIVGFVNWILGFVASIAVLLLIYGGYMWLTDQGDESNIEKAKTIIAGALIGILIIISAYTIVNTVLDFNDAYPDGCELGGNLETGQISQINLDCDFNLDTPSIGSGIGGIIGL